MRVDEAADADKGRDWSTAPDQARRIQELDLWFVGCWRYTIGWLDYT